MRQRAELDAQAHGYRLNPDPEFLQDLLEGLRVNEDRYGYPCCPCRMATGVFEMDRDVICPCDYRDPDVEEYGTCYCCLYVDKATHERGETRPIPERRPMEKQLRSLEASDAPEKETMHKMMPDEWASATTLRLFYCKQCGYVVFREEPPMFAPSAGPNGSCSQRSCPFGTHILNSERPGLH